MRDIAQQTLLGLKQRLGSFDHGIKITTQISDLIISATEEINPG